MLCKAVSTEKCRDRVKKVFTVPAGTGGKKCEREYCGPNNE